jgi:DNA invertase Pin-like site-specific DNA recombinase
MVIIIILAIFYILLCNKPIKIDKMIYGYIRVSTDQQTVENQRFEIINFCRASEIQIDGWIEENISGTKNYDKRKLGQLLADVDKGDRVICSELSRLGRELLMIMEILNILMKKEVELWTIKDNFRLGNSIESKVLAFAFGLSAEIERNLISQRTKEALARKKAEGVILGRPKGSKSSYTKLTGKEEKIRALLDKNISKSAIGRILGVNRLTVTKFISDEKFKTIIELSK